MRREFDSLYPHQLHVATSPLYLKSVELTVYMSIPKKYLRDRIVLLLLSISVFLTLLGSVLILLRLGSGQGSSYIVEYRANLGISAYTAGRAIDIIGFILFLFLVLGMNIVLSIKVYSHHRSYALTVLGMGVLLSLLTIIVSNALLILR